MKKLIILDRDGVINRDLGTYVTHPDEFEFIYGAIEAISALKKTGSKLASATNQAGIERGFNGHETLSAIHAKMLREIRANGGDIDRIVYCPSYDDAHPWRIPNAGMLTVVLLGFSVLLHDAVFVGDNARDMHAGFAAGCQLIMVSGKNDAEDYQQLPSDVKQCVRYFSDLAEASRILISEIE